MATGDGHGAATTWTRDQRRAGPGRRAGRSESPSTRAVGTVPGRWSCPPPRGDRVDTSGAHPGAGLAREDPGRRQRGAGREPDRRVGRGGCSAWPSRNSNGSWSRRSTSCRRGSSRTTTSRRASGWWPTASASRSGWTTWTRSSAPMTYSRRSPPTRRWRNTSRPSPGRATPDPALDQAREDAEDTGQACAPHRREGRGQRQGRHRV